MNKTYQVLTAIGPDRLGVVKEISAALHTCGCNLEDSRMALLAGKFALVLLLSGSHEAITQFRNQCDSLGKRLGFQLQLTDADATSGAAGTKRVVLAASGVDQPGIVHRIATVLAEEGMNVTSMESRVTHAAFTGTALFSLEAEVAHPSGAELTPSQVHRVREHLTQVCEQLDLTFTLHQNTA